MDVMALGAAMALLVFVLAFALAFAGPATGTQIRTRLQGVLSGAGPQAGNVSAVDPLRRSRPAGSMLQNIASGAWLSGLERELRLADSQLQPGDLITMRVALAGAGFVVTYLAATSMLGTMFGVIAALIVGIVGFQLPQMWLNHRKNQRSSKLEKQLPDTLTFIANSLKAGFGLLQAMSMAADQMEHPISTELSITVHETNVGSSMEEAFTNLSERCQNYDLDLVVTAILIQRSAGGNLSEILENVTETMRERARIKAEIVTLTAQQSLTGIVIALLPVGVGAMFLVISPEYISLLFTETMGRVMLGISVVMETIGIIVIKRILAIEV